MLLSVLDVCILFIHVSCQRVRAGDDDEAAMTNGDGEAAAATALHRIPVGVLRAVLAPLLTSECSLHTHLRHKCIHVARGPVESLCGQYQFADS